MRLDMARIEGSTSGQLRFHMKVKSGHNPDLKRKSRLIRPGNFRLAHFSTKDSLPSGDTSSPVSSSALYPSTSFPLSRPRMQDRVAGFHPSWDSWSTRVRASSHPIPWILIRAQISLHDFHQPSSLGRFRPHLSAPSSRGPLYSHQSNV